MRVYIGGIEYLAPARWYWCRPGAKVFPQPHGCEASPWLKEWETNDVWGEVTPNWPPAYLTRGLDRGVNRGYPGLCYIGERQWFDDGHLPASIFDGSVPGFPNCCLATGIADGSLILDDAPVGSQFVRPTAPGDLVLGGDATAAAVHPPATALGDLILAGAAAGAQFGSYAAAGDLILAGGASAGSGPASGSGSGSGSGSEEFGCPACADGAAAQFAFTMAGITGSGPGCDCAGLNASYLISYAGGCNWHNLSVPFCFQPAVNASLSVTSSLVTLAFYGAASYTAPRGAWNCRTPLTLTLSAAGLCATWPATVTITPV